MAKFLRVFVFLVVILGVTACAGLGKMKKVNFESEIEPNMAMVNIVRRSVFMGDGAKVEAWDGDRFIGTLGAGQILQYKAEPGDHTFMVYVQGHWGVAKGELKPGKAYYLKFNMTGWGPINLGVARADDQRIAEWKTMTTVVLDESSSKAVLQKHIVNARKTLQRVADGDAIVTPITDLNAL